MQLPRDVAATRLDNALLLFDEFVRHSAKQADAATLRGLERRFAERLQIQPSYWSQIKGRSRQIGERLARQFEQCCGKPVGWMDAGHAPAVPGAAGAKNEGADDDTAPRDEDERFIVGLVLTYYRRHPQRARTRLLGLLGEVLAPAPELPAAPGGRQPAAGPEHPGTPARPAPPVRPAAAPRAEEGEEALALWRATQTHVAPLKKKR
jgi:hypothetical protein